MIIIEREREEVCVAGRTFTLEEMTGTQLTAYLRELGQAAERAVARLVATGKDDLQEAFEEMAGEMDRFFVGLLSQPTDGQPVPDADWVRDQVSFRMRRRILAVQDQLNCTEEILGNGQSLLRKAAPLRRQATRS